MLVKRRGVSIQRVLRWKAERLEGLCKGGGVGDGKVSSDVREGARCEGEVKERRA